MSALITDMGATSESAKDAISLRATKRLSANVAIGDEGLSVRAITDAPESFAKLTAVMSFLEYLGKLIATTTSPASSSA